MENDEISAEARELVRQFARLRYGKPRVTAKPPSQEMFDLAWEVAQAYQALSSATSWREMPALALAASSETDGTKPIQLKADPSLGEHWTLTQTPVSGEQAFYLIFECYPNARERYVGRRVQVSYDDVTYDLGVVDLEGIAELRVAGDTILRTKDTMVRISEEADSE
jgi:hypothetical protein